MEGESKNRGGGGRGKGERIGVFGKQKCSESYPALFILNVVFQLFRKIHSCAAVYAAFHQIPLKSVLKCILLQKCLFELVFEWHFALWDGSRCQAEQSENTTVHVQNVSSEWTS